VGVDGWVRVIVTVPSGEAELAADLLWMRGAAAIEEQPAADGTRLLAGFEAAATGEQGRGALDQAGWPDAEVHAVIDDGGDAWRAFAQPERAGSWWVVPPWVDASVQLDDPRLIWIDPGRSFGSGSHATTRLVLEHLDRLPIANRRVLDVGCGSGVLSIAAARLGAQHVRAIDVDPEAIAATAANAAGNGVDAVVSPSTTPLDVVVGNGERFDVVMANVLAPVIIELARELVGALAPGGTLVVSGLLAERWAATAASLAPLQVVHVREQDGWAALELR